MPHAQAQARSYKYQGGRERWLKAGWVTQAGEGTKCIYNNVFDASHILEENIVNKKDCGSRTAGCKMSLSMLAKGWGTRAKKASYVVFVGILHTTPSEFYLYGIFVQSLGLLSQLPRWCRVSIYLTWDFSSPQASFGMGLVNALWMLLDEENVGKCKR